ncbi:hypothetical protein BJX70DRAFT_390925 [Aspergillus crustosus]
MRQPPVTPLPTNIDLTGKTAVITGSTAGLGLETARQLLTLNLSTLILAVRNVQKGESCAQDLLADPKIGSRNPNAIIKVLEVDMERYDSVQSFATKLQDTVPAIDILILNAGAIRFEFDHSPDGHERNMQINYYSNVLLLATLLPYLESCAEKTNAPVRITWLGSRTYYQGHSLDNPTLLAPSTSVLEYMDSSAGWNLIRRYADTKLLAAMFVYALAPRLNRDKVTLNIVCPGMIHTRLSSHGPWYFTLLAGILKWARARPIEIGGLLIVNAAVVVGAESHGVLLGDKEVTEPTDFMKSVKGQQLQERLWKETVKEIGKYTTVPAVFA